MVLSKLDLAIVALVAVGMLGIEHEHRIMIAMPAAAEAAAPAAAVCPENDSVPFSAACIAFIEGDAAPARHARARAATVSAVSPGAHGSGELRAAACPPSNENAPYSAGCIRFLSGWYWQPEPAAETH